MHWPRPLACMSILQCHTAVAAEFNDPSALHGALKGTATGLDCRGCHTEHRGPTARLTRLDPATFPHAATGYALTGHARMSDGRAFTCTDCHGENVTTFDGLKALLAPKFQLLGEPRPVPFVIRETRRKYQHSLSDVTIWERRG